MGNPRFLLGVEIMTLEGILGLEVVTLTVGLALLLGWWAASE